MTELYFERPLHANAAWRKENKDNYFRLGILSATEMYLRLTLSKKSWLFSYKNITVDHTQQTF